MLPRAGLIASSLIWLFVASSASTLEDDGSMVSDQENLAYLGDLATEQSANGGDEMNKPSGEQDNIKFLLINNFRLLQHVTD